MGNKERTIDLCKKVKNLTKERISDEFWVYWEDEFITSF